jgi:hypothetical protein
VYIPRAELEGGLAADAVREGRLKFPYDFPQAFCEGIADAMDLDDARQNDENGS